MRNQFKVGNIVQFNHVNNNIEDYNEFANVESQKFKENHKYKVIDVEQGHDVILYILQDVETKSVIYNSVAEWELKLVS